MAKKKKGKRHRQPVAPPVHSAPSSVHNPGHSPGPVGPPRPQGAEPSARPAGAVPPGQPVETQPARRPDAPRPVRQTPAQRKAAVRRQQRRRNIILLSVVIVVAIALIVGQRVLSSRSSSQFDALAKAAGCGKLQTIGGLGREHVDGTRVKYSTSPPAGGNHYSRTLPSGVYDEPLSTAPDTNEPKSIYRAVHSLEHGAVIVWYDDISKKQLSAIVDKFEDEDKVIVAPYPKLSGKTHLALTAWSKSIRCEKPSPTFINAFVGRFRGARSAPENTNPI